MSAGNAAAITQSRPCTGLHVHNPDDVWHWVVLVDKMEPVTVITDCLQQLPRHLRKEQMQLLLPAAQNDAINPFSAYGVPLPRRSSLLFHYTYTGPRAPRQPRTRQYQASNRKKPVAKPLRLQLQVAATSSNDVAGNIAGPQPMHASPSNAPGRDCTMVSDSATSNEGPPTKERRLIIRLLTPTVMGGESPPFKPKMTAFGVVFPCHCQCCCH